MNSKVGSTWNKWDFHVHTPYSILNNGYGFDPFENDDENKFDEFVKKLFNKAVEKNIVAIGITDYFIIDGYKRIKEQYLKNDAKMANLFPDVTIREKIKKIYIFPNIEFRLNRFVGSNSHSVNYHVIFSDEIPIEEIEHNFLGKLKIQNNIGTELQLDRYGIEKFGESIKNSTAESGSYVYLGLKHITVDYKDILSALNSDIFAGKHIITIPVDEDLSVVSWNGRDYSTRKILYQQCHCYMTSNQGTKKWALAEGEEESRISEFRGIKPCIWGSDAHNYDRMFNPDKDRFCWIKAEPSFEGLLQILYEPKDRVLIQKDNPSKTNIHQIIESIQFSDDKFQSEAIYFSDYLTCIIGGKSTGKSLLLRQTALAIDKDYVLNQEKSNGVQRSHLEVNTPVVKWKDGASEKRKIIYIPQSFLNRTIDNPEENTSVNDIIAKVLLQENEVKVAYDILQERIRKIRFGVMEDISRYQEEAVLLDNVNNDILEEGSSESFRNTIKNLEKQRDEIAKNIDIDKNDIEEYAKLEKSIGDLESQLKKYNDEKNNLESIGNPCVIIPKYLSNNCARDIMHDFKMYFPETDEKLKSILGELEKKIEPDWNKAIKELVKEIDDSVEEISKKLEEDKKQYEKLKVKVKDNETLDKLSVLIASEREKMSRALENEKDKEAIYNKMKTLRTNIISSRGKFFEAYKEYCEKINSVNITQNTNLEFEVRTVWRQNDFTSVISSVFNNRHFNAFQNKFEFNLLNLDDSDYSDEFLNYLWSAMDNTNQEGALGIKSGYNFDSALREIFNNWYNVHYVVKSGNDTIEKMSPGKKALVLLELIISLENSKCPILIDQPEDDLDNRSVYQDLVHYLKDKKKDRQIIVVTHNANIVLGADAEEVIIANQDGIGTENISKRFEYRSGAIENNRREYDAQGEPLCGILNKHGIQTQICDILEGGYVAFEMRKNKYQTN